MNTRELVASGLLALLLACDGAPPPQPSSATADAQSAVPSPSNTQQASPVECVCEAPPPASDDPCAFAYRDLVTRFAAAAPYPEEDIPPTYGQVCAVAYVVDGDDSACQNEHYCEARRQLRVRVGSAGRYVGFGMVADFTEGSWFSTVVTDDKTVVVAFERYSGLGRSELFGAVWNGREWVQSNFGWAYEFETHSLSLTTSGEAELSWTARVDDGTETHRVVLMGDQWVAG